jgi:broad specificity phosphatase PhoE
VRRILSENEGKTVLLATHAMPARCIECYAAGGDAARVSDFKVSPNAAIHIYTFEDGRLRSAGPNIVSHLEKPGEKLPSDLV